MEGRMMICISEGVRVEVFTHGSVELQIGAHSWGLSPDDAHKLGRLLLAGAAAAEAFKQTDAE